MDKAAEVTYDRDGNFGRVRLGYTPTTTELHDALGSVTFCGWHRCNDLYHIERRAQHSREYVLMLTCDGVGELVIAGKRHALQKRSFAIAPMDRAHTYYAQPGGEWEFYWMHVMGDHYTRMLEYMISEFGWVFDAPDYGEACQLMEGIMTTGFRGAEYEVFAASATHRLLFLLMQYRFEQVRRLDGHKALVYRVMELIDAHLFEDISINDIAKAMYVSREHIIRVFKSEVGQTPYQYIKRRRMAHACRLLGNTSMTVEEIGRSIGYRSTSAFIHQFRSEVRITPARYRSNVSQK